MRLLPRKARLIGNSRFHPFQEETVKQILEGRRWILTEAPVGSGKSTIIRESLLQVQNRPIILTYPTRILLQAQVAALRHDIEGLAILPWDSPGRGTPVLFEYSGATLLRMAREGRELGTRSELMHQLFSQMTDAAKYVKAVMTPDVLHLIVTKEFYRGSRHLERHLRKGLFVFDEFHLYFDLGHFASLVENIVERLDGAVVLLSATPLLSKRLKDFLNRYDGIQIGFGTSIAKEGALGRVFNHPLDLRLYEGFDLYDLNEELACLEAILIACEKPVAVIVDSLFRLRHIMNAIVERLGKSNLSFLEWSGERKQEARLTERTAVLGTSAIEVGVDLDFRTLVMEASTWASAVQRLGRVGRRSRGTVHLITRKRFMGLIDGVEQLDRTVFEQEVLSEVFRYSDPDEEKLAASSAGEMFRGDSYPFALYDVERKETYFGDEALFSRYCIVDPGCEEWRVLTKDQKARELRDHLRLPVFWVEEILLRDRVFPLWGVVKGRLRNKWEKVFVRSHDLELEIKSDETYYYYGKET
ncbi:MAG: DEAD/DEAH box helicase [Thermodesulfobacteriota bacterium]